MIRSYYCDGACSGNPGPGAWAVVVQPEPLGDPIKKWRTGSKDHTTNNEMELTAAIQAWDIATFQVEMNDEVKIYSDSKYVVNIFNKIWKPKTHEHLWEPFLALVAKYEKKYLIKTEMIWVKGHADNKLNILVDSLASSRIHQYLKNTI